MERLAHNWRAWEDRCVDWDAALNHARRLADDGHDVTIHVHDQADPLVDRTATVRVAKSSISDFNAFFSDATHHGLTCDGPKLIGDEYYELS